MEKEIYEKAVMEIIEMNFDVRTDLIVDSNPTDPEIGFEKDRSSVGW